MLIWKWYHTVSWIILTSSIGKSQNNVTLLDFSNDFDIMSEDIGFAKKRISRETSTPFYGAPKFRDYEGLFEVNNTEYILTNVEMTHEEAIKYCANTYNGRLAPILTVALANFIAEALSESNLVNASIWTAGRTEDNKSRTLFWYDGDEKLDQVKPEIRRLIDTREIDDRNTRYSYADFAFTNKLSKAIRIPAYNNRVPPGKDCLAIDRIYLDVPRFLPAICSQLKPILCERKRMYLAEPPINELSSTHPGWIKLKDTYYKIFAQKVSWYNARQLCSDKEAILAEPKETESLLIVARYLRIGRPTLYNAWVGAKYESDSNHFVMTESLVELNPIPDETNFPPWRNGKEQKAQGCLLLDRETSFGPAFIEANCGRKRAYICSRSDANGKEESGEPKIDEDINKWQDKIIDDIGYRFYYQLFSWEQAKDKCNSFKDKYGAQLAEVRSNATINHLLEPQAGRLLLWRQIWIGAKYYTEENTWQWDSDNSNVRTEVLNFVKNETYDEEAEKPNTCLNIDREKDVVFFYGTQCSWGQYFVCTFSSEQLLELQAAEKDEIEMDK